jgi:hypothetical protein
VDDAQPGVRRQPPGGEGGAERVLHRPQVPDGTRLERVEPRPGEAARARERLAHDPHLRVEPPRQDARRVGLQDEEQVREPQGFAGRGALPEIPVEVGAGEENDERPVRVPRAESSQSAVALPRVDRDERVASRRQLLPDRDVVAELAEDPRPAERRDTVAGPGPGRRGRDDSDPQPASSYASLAQVRNPHHTSRRSGP